MESETLTQLGALGIFAVLVLRWVGDKVITPLLARRNGNGEALDRYERLLVSTTEAMQAVRAATETMNASVQQCRGDQRAITESLASVTSSAEAQTRESVRHTELLLAIKLALGGGGGG